ncbi:unnamed protein product [Mycena citricolor]|uniref:PH domain-containing protein n=1 Tax=Mycena citricolor TaxID=2018698 RepID=A0AAD2HZC4_9AGAR|nr:unnamed protein product [Mycena citricolor]
MATFHPQVQPTPCSRLLPRQSRAMKKRRLSLFNRDTKDGRHYKTLPRSFTYDANAPTAYYDAPSSDALLISIPSSDTSFLLDDDPFADLTGAPLHTVQQDASIDALASPTTPTPTSPLGQVAAALPTHTLNPSQGSATRPLPSLTTPAYQKPAFRARPSLPSLHTLAQMNVGIPHKVRRGRVGAGLPFEPWDLDSDTLTPSSATASTPLYAEPLPMLPPPSPNPITSTSLTPSSAVASPVKAHTVPIPIHLQPTHGSFPDPVSPSSSAMPVRPRPELTAQTFLDLSSDEEDVAKMKPPLPKKTPPALKLKLPAYSPGSRLHTSPLPLSPATPSASASVPFSAPLLDMSPDVEAGLGLDLGEMDLASDADYAAFALGPASASLTGSFDLGADSPTSPGQPVEAALQRRMSKKLSSMDLRLQGLRSRSQSQSSSQSSQSRSRSSSSASESGYGYRYSTVIELGHESDEAVAFPTAYDESSSSNASSDEQDARSPEQYYLSSSYGYTPYSTAPASPGASSYGTRSPESEVLRSPERSRFDWFAQASSPPYSTPEATFSASSSSEGHAEFDFGWSLGEKVSEREVLSGYADATRIRSGSVYSDEELGGTADDRMQAFVFPSRVLEDEFEPGTSAGTIKASQVRQERGRKKSVMDRWEGPAEGEAVDAGEGSNHHYSSRRDASREGNSRRPTGRGDRDDGQRGFGGHGQGSGAGAGGGDDRDGYRGHDKHSAFSTPSSSSESEDSEHEASEDDYGTAEGASEQKQAAVKAPDGSDDDVPLAQRIPSALTAQRTIRRKVREERDERRAAREQRRAERAASGETRSRQTTLRPVAPGDVASGSSQEAARQAQAQTSLARSSTRARSATRARTQTVPVDDLTRKLQNMQTERLAVEPPAPARVSASASPPNRSQPLSEGRTLRAMRSFHRPSTAPGVDEPLITESEVKVRRAVSTRRPAGESSKPRTSNEAASPPVPSNKLTKSRPSGEGPRPPRTSADGLLASPQPAHRHVASKSQGTLTRIFVGDLQRFNMVNIGDTTTAKQVLAMVDEQGSLKGWVGTGGWMVWEVAQDFGMERPIRSFELLSEVQASWNKDKMVNMFVIRLTPLAPILSRSNLPTGCPAMSGYVEWEAKRGKWSKRFLRLREHSLWLSKRENGKDEICLCSLSNFDAYNVTRLQKAPKPFVFAVKSTDNLSLFENTADYLHVFSCNPSDGEKWVEKILLARSYVLYQERNVLFTGNSKPVATGTSPSAGLSRSATTRKPPGQRPSHGGQPIQPLINVDRNEVFQPGSLLREA